MPEHPISPTLAKRLGRRQYASETAKDVKGDYMTNVGKQGLKRQQQKMAQTADTQETEYEMAKSARQEKTKGKYNGAK